MTNEYQKIFAQVMEANHDQRFLFRQVAEGKFPREFDHHQAYFDLSTIMDAGIHAITRLARINNPEFEGHDYELYCKVLEMEKSERIELLREAQDLLGEVLEIIDQATRGTDAHHAAWGYTIPHLKTWISSNIQTGAINELMERINEEDE